MKKVMLLGDSIRLGYQDALETLLEGVASVDKPEENCRFSAHTLFRLQSWVQDDDYDLIQWNNGQWDTCYMPDGRTHTSLPHYLELQQRIADILKKKTKRLVFATTTPVWPEQFDRCAVHPRKNEDIIAYNRAITEQFTPQGIEINDLHVSISEEIKRYISKDMIHLSEAGKACCAQQTAELIRA